MCSHSGDLKLDWIQQGVMCLCLKSEGQIPPGTGGGSELPPGDCCCLVWDVLRDWGRSCLTCLLVLWQTWVPWLSCTAAGYCRLISQKLQTIIS